MDRCTSTSATSNRSTGGLHLIVFEESLAKWQCSNVSVSNGIFSACVACTVCELLENDTLNIKSSLCFNPIAQCVPFTLYIEKMQLTLLGAHRKVFYKILNT